MQAQARDLGYHAPRNTPAHSARRPCPCVPTRPDTIRWRSQLLAGPLGRARSRAACRCPQRSVAGETPPHRGRSPAAAAQRARKHGRRCRCSPCFLSPPAGRCGAAPERLARRLVLAPCTRQTGQTARRRGVARYVAPRAELRHECRYKSARAALASCQLMWPSTHDASAMQCA